MSNSALVAEAFASLHAHGLESAVLVNGGQYPTPKPVKVRKCPCWIGMDLQYPEERPGKSRGRRLKTRMPAENPIDTMNAVFRDSGSCPCPYVDLIAAINPLVRASRKYAFRRDGKTLPNIIFSNAGRKPGRQKNADQLLQYCARIFSDCLVAAVSGSGSSSCEKQPTAAAAVL